MRLGRQAEAGSDAERRVEQLRVAMKEAVRTNPGRRTAPAAIRNVRAHQSQAILFAATMQDWCHAIENQYADHFAKLAARRAAVSDEEARAYLWLEQRSRQVWCRPAVVGAAAHRDPSFARSKGPPSTLRVVGDEE